MTQGMTKMTRLEGYRKITHFLHLINLQKVKTEVSSFVRAALFMRNLAI